jgi:SSS family transporter
MSIQVQIFFAYFVVVFAIGWYGMRATHDEADYWIAGGKLGWFTGGATMAATHTSAGTFVGTIGVMYTAGWSFGWVLLSIPLAYWFVAAVLAPRFTRVRELTIPAFMQARYYSRKVRGLSAVVVLIATVVYMQAQIVAGGLIANIVFGLPTRWGMVGFTLILLAYTVVGGMIAVVYTDAFQLVVMCLGALFALPLAVHQVDGFRNLLTLVQSAHPTVFQWGTMPGTLLFTMGLAFFLGSIATPEKLVRLYAMRDMPTIRRGVLFAIVVITTLNLVVFLLGLAAIVLFPELPTGDLAMPMIATAVLPTTLGALMLAAITAAMMSTVDSLLIVAGSALSVDLYQNLIPWAFWSWGRSRSCSCSAAWDRGSSFSSSCFSSRRSWPRASPSRWWEAFSGAGGRGRAPRAPWWVASPPPSSGSCTARPPSMLSSRDSSCPPSPGWW